MTSQKSPAIPGGHCPPARSPCLQPAGFRENGALVTCKTGAVFWDSHSECCGQRRRREKRKREKSPQLALPTGKFQPGSSDTSAGRPTPLHQAENQALGGCAT